MPFAPFVAFCSVRSDARSPVRNVLASCIPRKGTLSELETYPQPLFCSFQLPSIAQVGGAYVRLTFRSPTDDRLDARTSTLNACELETAFGRFGVRFAPGPDTLLVEPTWDLLIVVDVGLRVPSPKSS